MRIVVMRLICQKSKGQRLWTIVPFSEQRCRDEDGGVCWMMIDSVQMCDCIANNVTAPMSAVHPDHVLYIVDVSLALTVFLEPFVDLVRANKLTQEKPTILIRYYTTASKMTYDPDYHNNEAIL